MLYRKFLSRFMLLASVFLFAACMGDLPESSTAQEREAIQKLYAIYTPITGFYGGHLTENPYGEPDIPVQMEIFISNVSNGRNENGQEKLVPVLQANYRRLDTNDPNQRYSIRSISYFEDGSITMTVPEKQGALPGVGSLSIIGRLENNILTATMADYRGTQGILRLEKLARPPAGR